jgi:hypothetical protein
MRMVLDKNIWCKSHSLLQLDRILAANRAARPNSTVITDENLLLVWPFSSACDPRVPSNFDLIPQ